MSQQTEQKMPTMQRKVCYFCGCEDNDFYAAYIKGIVNTVILSHIVSWNREGCLYNTFGRIVN